MHKLLISSGLFSLFSLAYARHPISLVPPVPNTLKGITKTCQLSKEPLSTKLNLNCNLSFNNKQQYQLNASFIEGLISVNKEINMPATVKFSRMPTNLNSSIKCSRGILLSSGKHKNTELVLQCEKLIVTLNSKTSITLNKKAPFIAVLESATLTYIH